MKNEKTYAELLAEIKRLSEEKNKLSEEKNKLSEEKTKLAEANAKLEKQVKELEEINNWLKEHQRLAQRRRFGPASDTAALPGQMSLFNEAETLATIDKDAEEVPDTAVPARKRKQRKRADFFEGLPVEKIVHELPVEERVCPCCSHEMHPRGEDVLRKEIEVIPAQVKVIKHVQVVYSCRKCEASAGDEPMTFKKSKVPAPVIKGSGIASPSLVALIMCNKYFSALPLYRQERDFKQLGLRISRQSMANWVVIAAHKWLSPIYERLRSELLRNHILHADETTIQVLAEEGRTAQQKSYMWVYATGCHAQKQAVLFEYQPTRHAKHPLSFLEGFSGYLHADAYGGYRCLEEKGVAIIGCWAHARRKFIEALNTLKFADRAGSLAHIGRTYCDKLFALEKVFTEKGLTFEERQERRLKESKPIMNEFFQWAESVLSQQTSKTTLSTALSYALNQRAYLSAFLRDPRLEISNNRAERAIRPFVVGRKNWLFAQSPNGAEASAIVYSIIETAVANGLVPFDYLKYIFSNLPNIDPHNLDDFLPWAQKVKDCCSISPLSD